MLKVILLIIGLHIFADFTLQGLFGNLKQKDYWLKMFGEGSTWISYEGLVRKYGKDYKAAIFCHALYWTLITFSPLIYLAEADWFIATMVVVNTAVHYAIDDQKANVHTINLIQDQLMHFGQIAITVLVWVCWF